MKKLSFLIFILFSISSLTYGALDAARENSFQKALSRYGASSSKIENLNTATPDSEATEIQTSEGESFNSYFSGSSVVFNDVWFRSYSINSEKERINIYDSRTIWSRINTEDFNYGRTVLKNYSSLTENFPGDSILVESNVTASVDRHDRKKLFADHKYERDFDQNKIIFLGRISHSGPFYTDIESSLSVLRTLSFDPCLVTDEMSLKVKYLLEELSSSYKYEISANCMLTKSLEGDFSARIVFTNIDGELIEHIRIKNDFSLSLSESLSLKFESQFIDGLAPLENEDSTSPRPVEPLEEESLNTPVLPIGFDSTDYFSIQNFFFTKRKLKEGGSQVITLRDQKQDEDAGCSYVKSLSFGRIKDVNREDNFVYSLKWAKNCLDESSESGSEQALSINNEFEMNQKAVNNISYRYETFNEDGSFGLSLDAFLTPEDKFLLNQGSVFYDFNINKTTVQNDGRKVETSIRVVHSKADSILVTQRLWVFPRMSARTKLALQTPEGEASDAAVELKDAFLCDRIDCFSLGAAVSFTEEGGAFLTTKGETASQIFGNDFNIELIIGVPVNIKGENESWGQSFNYQSFSSGVTFGGFDFGRYDPSFYEINMQSKDCNLFKEFCTELKFRNEENDKNQQFMSRREF